MSYLAYLCAICISVAAAVPLQNNATRFAFLSRAHGDSSIPPKPHETTAPKYQTVCYTPGFKCYWLANDGGIYNVKWMDYMLEVAATDRIGEYDHYFGAVTVSKMVKNLPLSIFQSVAQYGSVGLFTFEDKTTIFPEYSHLRDRPECMPNICSGHCANTCTADGRKIDSLVGLGGSRGTCMDDNFMCLPTDPYGHATNILVHEFAHTLHGYGLFADRHIFDYILKAYNNARSRGIWDSNSYAMANEFEYFAEATGVYFNVNHYASSGGMSSCGRPHPQQCQSEAEARYWLWQQDPLVFSELVAIFSAEPGNMQKCPWS